MPNPEASLRPIFVVGSGRSGTTLLFDLLRGHPDLAWISRLTDSLPAFPSLAWLSRHEALARSRILAPSTDAIRTYHYCGITAAQLENKRASLTGDDLSAESARKLRRIVAAHARAMGRPRFINKSTLNTMRIRMIRAVFSDAYFVHLIRNGYAVASSLVRVKWWPDAEVWWLGKTPRQWEDSGGDPIELAAMNWNRQVGEILAQKSHIPEDRFIECRYEELLESPVEVVGGIAEFCGLEWTGGCAERVRGAGVNPHNRDRWRDRLDADQKATIHRVAGDRLVALGYDSPA